MLNELLVTCALTAYAWVIYGRDISFAAVFKRNCKAFEGQSPLAHFAHDGLYYSSVGMICYLLSCVFWFGVPSSSVTTTGLIALVLTVLFILVNASRSSMGGSWREGTGDGARDQASLRLKTSGLFQFVRNPFYLFSVLYTSTLLLLVGASPFGASLLCIICVFLGVIVRLEEELLIALHGPQYADYAHRVGRWFPGIGRLAASTSQ